MKKWKRPAFSIMNLSKTAESQICTCGGAYGLLIIPADNDGEKNVHYCHYLKQFHLNHCASIQGGGHFQSGNCKDGVHWNESHKSNCCCKGRVDAPGDDVVNPS